MERARAFAESVARASTTIEQTRQLADRAFISGLSLTSTGELPAGLHQLIRSLIASALTVWQQAQLGNEAFIRREFGTALARRSDAESTLLLIPSRVRIAIAALHGVSDAHSYIAELRSTLVAFVSGSGLARAVLDGPRALEWHQDLLASFMSEQSDIDDCDVGGLGVPKLAVNGRGSEGKRSPGRTARPALSSREREVLGQIVGGLTTAEIAYQLGVKTTTIATLVGRIFNKLGVNNRAAAVALALKYGLCGTFDEGLT